MIYSWLVCFPAPPFPSTILSSPPTLHRNYNPCGGLNEDGPEELNRFECLVPGGGSVWEELEDGCHWKWALRFPATL